MIDPRKELFLGWLRERDAQVSRMLEPWIAIGFDCVQMIHSMGAEPRRADYRKGATDKDTRAAKLQYEVTALVAQKVTEQPSAEMPTAPYPLTSPRTQRGERGPSAPPLPPRSALAILRRSNG